MSCCFWKNSLLSPFDLLTLHLESLLDDPNPHLATTLASEFLKFGKVGRGSLTGRYKTLWDETFKEWNFPYQMLQLPFQKPTFNGVIHLFNFPFLPKIYHLFFAKLATYFPVHYYQFSPCREFWSDGNTNRETVRLIKKNPEITPYLDEGHPLLANFGKLTRATFRTFEEEDFLFDEHYVSQKATTT